MVPVREHFVLLREECPAGIDEIHARKVVLLRDLLRSQMLLNSDGVVRTSLHGSIVSNNHDLFPVHAANASDDAAGWEEGIFVQLPASQRR